MACNCKNGTTVVDYLTPIIGGTAENANYLLSLTHWTCGNRKICANGFFPITSNLNCQVLNAPHDVGNGAFCCDVLVSGTCTYMPYRCGQQCQCNQCPVTDNIFVTLCVPCSSAATPTVTAGKVVATPTNLSDCCNVTNAVGISTTINVATAATQTANGD